MIRYLDSENYGRSRLGWLDSHFHFSFAEYYNEANMNFGVLRVINDDTVQAQTGFDTHPHKNMEIISYVIEGELTHGDNMGNKQTLTRGQVQYMSAGTGVYHSEHNLGEQSLRFLQIWILPNANGYQPSYGDYLFQWEERIDKWLPIAANDTEEGFPIQMHADVHIYARYFKKNETVRFDVAKGRQAYMVLIDGDAQIQDIQLHKRDAVEIVEENVHLHTSDTAHVLMIEMAKI